MQHRVCQQPPAQRPPEGADLDARARAAEHTTVHEILIASYSRPHRLRHLDFQPHPDFEAKLLDVVEFYLSPPENALVLCVMRRPAFKPCTVPSPVPLNAKKPRAWTNEYVRFIEQYYQS